MKCPAVADCLVVIDHNVPEAATLVENGVVVTGGGMPIAQIAAAVETAGTPPAELHVVAHGEPGVLHLGGERLTAASIADQANDLARIGRAMAPGGVIALTACEVADGPEGRALLDALAEVVPRIRASADPVRSAS